MKLAALLIVGCALAAAPPQSVFDVRSFGAAGDGAANDTASLQRAIDACHRQGGGLVYLPAGRYFSGTITLKSNVTLHLSPGATLLGSPRIEDYNPRHLVYARGANNIAIEGGGVIDGNGGAFWVSAEIPKTRPSPLIELVECQHVRVENVRILNAPGWILHPLACDHVTIRGVTMIAPFEWRNTDGIDLDSCRNVRISDCYIRAGDDCIVLKTTGWLGLPAPPCENVTVTNCVLASAASGLKLGTESHGDFRNCAFSNCVITDTWNGLGIFAKDGGTFESIRFSNISIRLKPMGRGYVNEWPIFIDLEKRHPNSRVSTVRDVCYEDIVIHSQGRVLIAGMPDRPLENISLLNILFRVTGFEKIANTNKPRGGRAQPVTRETNYGPAPSAIAFANVRGLYLDNVRVVWDSQEPPPPRHAIYAARVEDVSIRGFSGRAAEPGGQYAAIGLDQAKRVFISGSRLEGKGVFLGTRKTPASEILLSGNDLRHADAETKEGALYVHIP